MSILKKSAFERASRSKPYSPAHRGISERVLSNADLWNQQLNIEKRGPQCTCDSRSQNNDHPRNRVIVSVGIEGVGIPIDLLSPLFWEELQCPGIHNKKDIEQGKHKAEI